MNWHRAGFRSRTTRCGNSFDARGFGSKKTLFALEQARADIARRRQRWRAWQAGLDPRKLDFIDETWIKTSMAPLRGWGPHGKRLRGFASHRHWRTLTFLGAHKSTVIRQAIKAAGARLWFQPPYSPDLNPIEQAFIKTKHWRRTSFATSWRNPLPSDRENI